MDRRTERNEELAQFLRAMRARLRPDDVGLPSLGRRRTPGLRRQEVAQLAAVSVEWYVRLEQGRAGEPGTAVLDGLARALRLSSVEREHLHVIARGRVPAPRPRPVRLPVSQSLRVLLAGIPLLPAYVVDFRLDVLAHNSAAAALFGEDFGSGDTDNVARMLFLSPRVRDMQLDWAHVARETVGNLRATLGRHHEDPRLVEVIGELRAGSSQFAQWWDDHTVRQRAHGAKRIRHPSVGDLAVRYDTLATLDGAEQCLVVVTPADAAAERCLRVLMVDRAGSLSGPGLHTLAAPAHSPEVAPGSARPGTSQRLWPGGRR
ncbi:helix-turn-helix transcriptional regulator [Streptomyces sp. NPDC051582]|uniref:helix-turn-helix transcriptional regulator n=1 Tax=Streptomyces sp. NPDC051582 TaxID=3155167 RepID=UPI0034234070